MTRPTRRLLLVTVAAALVTCGAAFFAGRSSGAREAPDLAVERIERIDRPRIGPRIPLPAPIRIPASLPR